MNIQFFKVSLFFPLDSLISLSEFLRFIYYGQVELHEDLAMKLLILSDKYLQDDLKQKTLDFLLHHITVDNVYRILDFARQENLLHLKKQCIDFLCCQISTMNGTPLFDYLDKPQNLEFIYNENHELRSRVAEKVLENYVQFFKKKKPNLKLYQEFLSRVSQEQETNFEES